MSRGASRGVLVVVVAAVATVALAWFLLRPKLVPSEQPTASAPPKSASDELASQKTAEPAAAPATPSGETLPVWETRDGSLHIGDDPPPESHELGKLTVRDAQVLGSARAEAAERKPGTFEIEELLRRIRQDTARRPIVGAGGDPTWSVRDIEGIVVSGDALDVATNWITNPAMIRVARSLCRYVSAQGDTYESSTVVVRGRNGRILARCKALG